MTEKGQGVTFTLTIGQQNLTLMHTINNGKLHCSCWLFLLLSAAQTHVIYSYGSM